MSHEMDRSQLSDAERVRHLRAALLRISDPEAFYVAAGSVDPETLGRMVYAQAILDGYTLKAANDKAEYEAYQRGRSKRNGTAA